MSKSDVTYNLETLTQKSTEEVWRDVPGFDGKYQVSNFGRVKRLSYRSYFESNNQVGSFTCHKDYKEKIWEVFDCRHEYPYIVLRKDGSLRKYSIHRLVASAFIENPDNLPEVNHIDGNTKNCRSDNLEWATRKSNAIHAVQVLNKGRGETHGGAKLSEKVVLEIISLYERGKTRKELQSLFSLSKSHVARIVTGTAWKHLKGNKNV